MTTFNTVLANFTNEIQKRQYQLGGRDMPSLTEIRMSKHKSKNGKRKVRVHFSNGKTITIRNVPHIDERVLAMATRVIKPQTFARLLRRSDVHERGVFGTAFRIAIIIGLVIFFLTIFSFIMSLIFGASGSAVAH